MPARASQPPASTELICCVALACSFCAVTPMLCEVKKERLERQAIGGQAPTDDSPAFFWK
jgi:hypothetical protein